MIESARCHAAVRHALLAACVCTLAACAGVEPEVAATKDAPGAEAVGTEAVADTGVAEAEAVAAAEDPNEMICRRERATGSHFTRRVCRTRAQLEFEQENAREIMRRRVGPGMDPSAAGTPSGG